MGVKYILRNTDRADRLAVACKFLNRYWSSLTVRQVNFLSRYVKTHGVNPY